MRWSGGTVADLAGRKPCRARTSHPGKHLAGAFSLQSSVFSVTCLEVFSQEGSLPGTSVLDMSLVDSFSAVPFPPGGCDLPVRVQGYEHPPVHYTDREAALVSSLLHAAAGLSPAEFRLALPRDIQFFHVEMPRFHRATSIELTTHYLHLLLSRISRFPALQRLSLSGCRVDLADLVHRCPCLRVLRVASGFLDSNITIKSESLGELAAESLNKWTA